MIFQPQAPDERVDHAVLRNLSRGGQDVVEHMRVGENRRDAALISVHAQVGADGLAVQADVSRFHRIEPGEHLGEGGLAASLAADQESHLARPELGVDRTDRESMRIIAMPFCAVLRFRPIPAADLFDAQAIHDDQCAGVGLQSVEQRLRLDGLVPDVVEQRQHHSLVEMLAPVVAEMNLLPAIGQRAQVREQRVLVFPQAVLVCDGVRHDDPQHRDDQRDSQDHQQEQLPRAMEHVAQAEQHGQRVVAQGGGEEQPAGQRGDTAFHGRHDPGTADPFHPFVAGRQHTLQQRPADVVDDRSAEPEQQLLRRKSERHHQDGGGEDEEHVLEITIACIWTSERLRDHGKHADAD